MTHDEWARGHLKESGMADADVRFAPIWSKPDIWFEGAYWPGDGQISERRNVLAAKIKEGASAGDALLRSIFSIMAYVPLTLDSGASTLTVENLADPLFFKDLSTDFYDNGSSVAKCRELALRHLLTHQVGSSGQEEIQALPFDQAVNLLKLVKFAGQNFQLMRDQGLSLTELAATPIDQREALAASVVSPAKPN